VSARDWDEVATGGDQDAQGDDLAAKDRAFCQRSLPRVSRTFALCIRLLPTPLEYPVVVAYLLCRIADTIEDTAALTPQAKRALLDRFSRCLDDSALNAGPLAAALAGPTNDDQRLAHGAAIVLREFHRLCGDNRDSIRPWVQEMCSGMAILTGMAADGGTSPRAVLVDTVADLDRYCYYVAGTVGKLLTDLFTAHIRGSRPAKQPARLQRLGVRFGLGLQVTNIVRDIGDDLSRGANYVPRQLCREQGIEPTDMLDPRCRGAARKVANALIDKAFQHLGDALEYCAALPHSQYRMRVACSIPMLLAVRTLRLARRDSRLLDRFHRVKISRGAVYRTVAMTTLAAASNLLMRGYFGRLAGTLSR
jgi:farnesyl-diphosphate farnesyltransferase